MVLHPHPHPHSHLHLHLQHRSPLIALVFCCCCFSVFCLSFLNSLLLLLWRGQNERQNDSHCRQTDLRKGRGAVSVSLPPSQFVSLLCSLWLRSSVCPLLFLSSTPTAHLLGSVLASIFTRRSTCRHCQQKQQQSTQIAHFTQSVFCFFFFITGELCGSSRAQHLHLQLF